LAWRRPSRILGGLALISTRATEAAGRGRTACGALRIVA
jgi:hypothetical protein